jgi:hypothetical protein
LSLAISMGAKHVMRSDQERTNESGEKCSHNPTWQQWSGKN